jgi:hypothetical protein
MPPVPGPNFKRVSMDWPELLRRSDSPPSGRKREQINSGLNKQKPADRFPGGGLR